MELKPTSRSFYGLETLDVVMEDFSDMEKALKKNGLQNESELTVGDFCGAVERLQIENPEACRRLLNSWARIIVIDGKPKWRRLLFKTIGI